MDFSDYEAFLKRLILNVLLWHNSTGSLRRTPGFSVCTLEGHFLLQMVNSVLTPLSHSQAQVDDWFQILPAHVGRLFSNKMF